MINKSIELFIKAVKRVVEDPDHSFNYQPPELLFNSILMTLQQLGQNMEIPEHQDEVSKNCIKLASLVLILWVNYTAKETNE